MKYYIGIDNGVTGSVCVLDEDGKVMEYFKTPTFKSLNYTKVKGFTTRVDGRLLSNLLDKYAFDATCLLERPMINPGRWNATVSAIRCDETTRTILEMLKMKFIYCDSREWQTPILPTRKPVPKSTKLDSPERKVELKRMKAAFALETKALSLATGQRLFPAVTFKKDADAALIAEWARREKL